MILFHGSNIVIESPKIITSEKGRDFGFAFYLTPIKEQAERMAIRRCKINRSGRPIVSVFEWNEKKDNLNYRCFDKPDVEWLDLIVKCRSDAKYSHNYDIVEGKIADDSVGETVLFVMDGIISKEDAVERLKFQQINSQIAFCTEKSLLSLRYLYSYEVE